MKSNNTLSKLALMASDMAYAANNEAFAADKSALRPYPDTSYGVEAPYYVEPGFLVNSVWKDPASGFKAIAFRNDSTNEVIVAFGGTDGLDPQDWAANSLHLGWNQWDRNRSRVLDYLKGYPTAKIHFTGQSLGGALAEYAAYDFIVAAKASDSTESVAARQSRSTLTTFNGLGGEEALKSNRSADFRTSYLAGLSEAAAYVVRNDLVSRLGTGHAGVATYFLDYMSTNQDPASGRYYDLDPKSAHRIETGLYAKLSPALQFDEAQPISAADATRRMLAMSETQRMMGLFGGIFSEKAIGPAEAKYRIAAGLLAGAAFGNAKEIDQFTQALFDAFHNSGDFGVGGAASKLTYWLAKRIDWGATTKVIAAANIDKMTAAYAGFIGAALNADASGNARIADGFSTILGKSVAINRAADPIEQFLKDYISFSAIPDALADAPLALLLRDAGIDLATLADKLAAGALWQQGVLDYLGQATGKTGMQLLQYRWQVTGALRDALALTAAAPELAGSVLGAQKELAQLMLGEAKKLATLRDDYTAVPLDAGDGSPYGAVGGTAFVALKPLADAFVRNVKWIGDKFLTLASGSSAPTAWTGA